MAKEQISSLSTKEPVTGVHDKPIASPYEQMETHDSAAPLQGNIVSTSKTDDWWIWELLGVLGSALAISGLCILLKEFNGKPLPRWFYTYEGKMARFRGKSPHITLNSIIEAISIVARLCLLIPITRGLSQLKWVWFAEKERTLTDLIYFEAASKQSLLDSVKLIWSLKARHFAVMGALAVIAAQGFSFFTQNLVTYPIMYLPDPEMHKPLPPNTDQLYANWTIKYSNDPSIPLPLELQTARIANATTYQAVTPGDAPYYNVDPIMKANIWAAIYAADTYGSWSIPSYFCSTGNCTWEGYSSLGVCSHCSDLTSKLTKNCVPRPGIDPPGVTGCDVSLPNGFNLGGVEGSRYNLMAMNTSFQPLVYTNYTSPIAVVQSITAYDTFFVNSTTPINASECALIPCVLKYANSFAYSSPVLKGTGYNGVIFLESVDTIWDSYNFDSNQQSPLNGPTINVPLNTSRNDPTKFSMDQGTYLGLKYYTNALLNGFVRGNVTTENLSFLSDNRTQNVTASPQDAMQAIYQPCLGFDVFGNPMSDWAACAMTLLAGGMTKIIRDSKFNLTTNSAIGDTYVGQQIVTVSWVWIIPAVGLWLLSAITLMGTAWKTRRTRVKTWRGNPLALVFLGLGRKELEEVKQHGLTEDGLVKKAEALKVQLRFTDRQAELVHA